MNGHSKRKLSFLGFGTPNLGADPVELDSEMDRVFGREPNFLREEHAFTHRDVIKIQREHQEPNNIRRVQFGALRSPLSEQDLEKHFRGHNKYRKYSLQEENGIGTDLDEPLQPSNVQDQVTEANYRNGAHVEKTQASDIETGLEEDEIGETGDQNKKTYDHKPHSVFVQLDELSPGEGGKPEWKQTARWIKYEEDVEEGSDRWGRPHVAPLSFHSLLNLRRCLEAGVVLLDLEERDLPGVAFRVVESMVSDRLIEEADKAIVMRSLLLRHKHVHEDRSFRFIIGGRKHLSYSSLQFQNPYNDNDKYGSSHMLTEKLDMSGARSLEAELSVAANFSHEELRRHNNGSIIRRIPYDAEATTVLVGAVDFLEQPTIAFVRLSQSILMDDVTEVPVPVRFMFILLGPSTANLDYHEVGRAISTLMSNPSFHKIAYKAEGRKALLSAINEFLDDSIVLPPGELGGEALLPFNELRAKSEMIQRRKREALQKKNHLIARETVEENHALLTAETERSPPEEPYNPLSRTRKIFGGVVRDIKQRYRWYISDFVDALNGQCLAATIFMYFAALSSAITFGGLLAEKTYGAMGISETLVFTCAGGIIFSLLSGQPLMITGATGPLLLLDEGLADFCQSYKFDFLAARMYCGLWMIIIALVVAAFEGSVAVKRITRFTEDMFAFLISMIFISEPITATINIYRAHPVGYDYCSGNSSINQFNVIKNDTFGNNENDNDMQPQPNTALFCTMLTLSTFIIAYYLRIFRNGKFLGRSVRRALGDFGVPIGIVTMVGVSCFVPVWTETLKVPSGLSPTASRSWLVPLNPGIESIPVWAAFASLLPALMVYIIVFLETHIAELIVDKPERKLKKGSGFHMDIVLISFVNALCGMAGAPWQCVATVRSVSHVSALTVMSTTHAPGDHPHVLHIKEQRVTSLMVSILVGISVLASSWLRLVPMAVLFGVFFYMGISALGGIQFWDRCILMLKPVKHHPQVPYVRRVPTMKMHIYTLIQIAGLIVLYIVKSSKFSLALPVFLVLCVPLRMSLVHIFTSQELSALDCTENVIEKDDEPDFYEEAPLPG